MDTIINMFKHMNASIVASDADYKVIYQNEKCRKLFGQVFGTSDYIGKSLHELHKPEISEMIKTHYKEYKEKKRGIYHYVTGEPHGTVTIVNSPFYDDNGEFAGVVEFIFESSLA
jgi:PAS domain S-box-containing protein